MSENNSPLRPARWMMPAISNYGLSPYPTAEAWYSNRPLAANSLDELQLILEDGYIRELCHNLVGDYVVVNAGEISIPVTTATEDSRDLRQNFPERRYYLTGGVNAENADYRHHLVIRGGVFKMEFIHEIDAPATLWNGKYQHWSLHTMMDLCIFKNLHGVTFFENIFSISGKVIFNDNSETSNTMGNNAPNMCTVNSEDMAIFRNCSGLSFINVKANIFIGTENV